MASLGLDNSLFAALINWLSGCWAIWPAGEWSARHRHVRENTYHYPDTPVLVSLFWYSWSRSSFPLVPNLSQLLHQPRGTTMYLQEIGATAHSDQAARQVVPQGQGRWTWHFVGWGRLRNCFLMAHVYTRPRWGVWIVPGISRTTTQRALLAWTHL